MQRESKQKCFSSLPIKINMHNLYSASVCVQKTHLGWLSECPRAKESLTERTGVSTCVHCVHWVMKGCHSSLLSQSSSRDGCRGKCILPGLSILRCWLLTFTHTLWHIATQHINTWEHGCHLDMPKHRHTGSLRGQHSQVTESQRQRGIDIYERWRCGENVRKVNEILDESVRLNTEGRGGRKITGCVRKYRIIATQAGYPYNCQANLKPNFDVKNICLVSINCYGTNKLGCVMSLEGSSIGCKLQTKWVCQLLKKKNLTEEEEKQNFTIYKWEMDSCKYCFMSAFIVSADKDVCWLSAAGTRGSVRRGTKMRKNHSILLVMWRRIEQLCRQWMHENESK